MSIFTKEVIIEVEKPITFDAIISYLASNKISDIEAEKLLNEIVKDGNNKVTSFIIKD